MYLYHSKYTIFSSFGPKKTNIEDISDIKKEYWKGHERKGVQHQHNIVEL
jgi:hypothetical protein